MTGGVPWGWAEEMTTATVETLHALTRYFLEANGVKRAKLPRPLVISRPWEKRRRGVPMPHGRQEHGRRRHRPATIDEVKDVFASLGMGA